MRSFIGLSILFFVFFQLASSCNSVEDCNNGGYCLNTGGNTGGICICYDDRAGSDCSYHRHNKDIAKGLQFLCFAGIGGVGNFYIGRIGQAMGQLILVSGLMVIYVLIITSLIRYFICDSDPADIWAAGWIGVVAFSSLFIAIAGISWSLIDVTMMSNGTIVDGNGYSLY